LELGISLGTWVILKHLNDQIHLAVDLGAESGRVMAGLWDGQTMRLEHVHRFPNEPVAIGNGLHWDIARLWLEIQNGLAIASRNFGKRIVSVGVDTWGVDYVLLSKHSELLGQPYHYRDRRTRGVMEAAFTRMPRADIFAETGLQFLGFNTLYQLLALQKHAPEILAAANRLLMIPDYLHWCLCGAQVGEFTNASTTQLLHPNGEWSRELLEKFNLPANIFPEIVRPGTRLGALRDSVAERAGLDKIAVIAPATHDTGSAVAAVPTANTGKANWAYLSSGTWSLMGVELQQAQLSPRVLEWNFTNEGGVDGTYRLLKNIMGLWLVQQCKRSFEARGKKFDYTSLMQLAASERPLASLVNPNDSRFLNPPDMPHAIQDFCRETGQPVPESESALIRCALESLALIYRHVLCGLEEVTGTPIEVIHIIGGGSQNELLNQFTADACARPVLAGPVEATALGNLLMQARACSELGSLSELRSVVTHSSEVRRFEPNAKTAASWEEAQTRFTKLLQS
jgi:rhamnulokinase